MNRYPKYIINIAIKVTIKFSTLAQPTILTQIKGSSGFLSIDNSNILTSPQRGFSHIYSPILNPIQFMHYSTIPAPYKKKKPPDLAADLKYKHPIV